MDWKRDDIHRLGDSYPCLHHVTSLQLAMAAKCSCTAKSASEYLLDIVRYVLGKEDFNLESDRCKQMQAFGNQFVENAVRPSNVNVISGFVIHLLDIFDVITEEASGACAKERKKLWSKFHVSRCTTIDDLWLELTHDLKASGSNPMLFQAVSRELFEERLSLHFPNVGHSVIQLDQEITLDEKNIIMYACGYVPVALINRYEKREDPKYASYVQCLLHMSIGIHEDSFYDYARKWLESVNRGGAFEVSDGTFNFFLVLENCVRHALSMHLNSGSTATTRYQEIVVEQVMSTDDIQFHWEMLSVDISDDSSHEILRDIVKLWLNIRGFSLIGSWVEQRKKLGKVGRKCGLRKSLKNSED